MTKKGGIASRLRETILSGVDSGVLRAGDRLPSSRELAPEFDADPRVVAAAYRALSMEALVEIRPKSGVYVSSGASNRPAAASVPVNWLADVFVDSIRLGVPIHELGSSVLDYAETRRIRAAVIADTADQALGISAELKREYGLSASPHHLAEIRAERLPSKVASAQVFFAANDCALEVRKIARSLKRPMVAVGLRPDIFDADWMLLIEREVYVVATDPAFIRKIPRIFPRSDAELNVKLMLVGRDDMSLIPRGAPTYVTESARRALGTMRLPGRVIQSRRLFSDETVRDVVSFIIAHNSASI